jgi:D-alanyl-D-alanine dipeptidase
MIRWFIAVIYTVAALLFFIEAKHHSSTHNPLIDLQHLQPTDVHKIVIEMRYHGYHNFVGRPVVGYLAPKCLLSHEAAKQLVLAQEYLVKHYGMTLKIYDCYRPQQSVDDFVQWSKHQAPPGRDTRKEFYPSFGDRKELFTNGFIAYKSGHSRGSTVDLTIVPLPVPEQQHYTNNTELVPCDHPYDERFRDNSIDMGTGFDCFSNRSHTDPTPDGIHLTPEQKQNRELLVNLMSQFGFKNYVGEWWHYTLMDEPFPHTYFNFPIE